MLNERIVEIYEDLLNFIVSIVKIIAFVLVLWRMTT